MMNLYSDLAADLERLSQAGRRRRLLSAIGLDFTSNDYLALAGSEELKRSATDAITRGAPAGSGGSRLLRGNHPEHEALERCAERYFGCESALYFGSGYAANLTLFSTLPQRTDLVIHDEYIHASVHDGLRRSRAARIEASRHNDLQSIADCIARWRSSGATGRIWIAVESLYSMDGDGPDLEALAGLAGECDAVLVIDEAHATGVLGPAGRGRAAALEGRDNIVTVHTCGKALGTEGAFVCASSVVTDFLVNRGRAFIFGTAPSPLMAAITRSAIEVCERSDERRTKLGALVEEAARASMRECGLAASGSHIVPVIIGADRLAIQLAHRMQEQGFDIRAIRPPTVPNGTARLRVALTLHVSVQAVSQLFEALGRELCGREMLLRRGDECAP